MDTEIEEVKQEIRKVQQQIDDVEGQLTKAATEADDAYLRDKKKQLREKERQLQEEKLLLLKADTLGPGNVHLRQQWLKQELPGLKLAFSAQPGLRNEENEYHLESVKMWESFREDVADYVAALASSDKVPLYDFSHVARYTGATEDSVRSVHELILSSLASIHSFMGCSILPNLGLSTSSLRARSEGSRANLSKDEANAMDNADANDPRQFVPDVVLKLGSKFFLVVGYEKPSFFRQSTKEPLRDLVSRFAEYFQHGRNAQPRALVLTEAIRKVYKFMVELSVGNAVISSADASYFVRRVDGAEGKYQNCVEISEGYAWTSKDPTMLKALSYVMDRAARDQKEYEFQNAAALVTVVQESHETESADDRKRQDSDVEVKNTKRSKFDCVYETRGRKRRTDGLQETAAENLHLEALPFATGWSGNIVRGRIGRHRVAVKLAPIRSIRAEALINEARAYNRLKQYWGRYLPKLISHGTTVNGQVVYIATEFVNGYPIGIEPLTEAVAVAAFEALKSVHASGMLHGDIRKDNILVMKGGVRLIDFGFSEDSTSNEEHKKELEQLLEIINPICPGVRHNWQRQLFLDFIKPLHSMGVSLTHANA